MNACGILSVPTHAVFFTNGRSSVTERDYRLARVLRHRDPHLLKEKLHLVCIGMRKVEEQNLLALVLDEMDAIIHCGPRMVFPVLLCVPCG